MSGPIELTTPAGWARIDAPGAGWAALAPDAHEGFRANVTLLVQDQPDTTLDGYARTSVDAVSRIITDGEVVDVAPATLAGLPARTIEYTGRQGRVALRHLCTFTLHAHRAWVLTYTAPAATFRESLRDAMTVMDSFAFVASGRQQRR